MPLHLITTGDGSKTLAVDEAGTEIYHSRHGALAEARHVFIEAGLQAFADGAKAGPPIRVLEVGAGTCLNMALTLQWTRQTGRPVEYVGIEPSPPDEALLEALDYPALLGLDAEVYQQLTRAGSVLYHEQGSTFQLKQLPLQEADLTGDWADVVFQDAFSPRYQSELWTAEVFGKLFMAMAPGGLLVTYCAQGALKRTLRAMGFTVGSLPGPKGKREMTQARKPA